MHTPVTCFNPLHIGCTEDGALKHVHEGPRTVGATRVCLFLALLARPGVEEVGVAGLRLCRTVPAPFFQGPSHTHRFCRFSQLTEHKEWQQCRPGVTCTHTLAGPCGLSCIP